MRVELVPAGGDLVAAAADAVLDGAPAGASVDLSDRLVLFPGERPGHFLRRLLGDRLGRAFVPPRIQTPGDLVDDLFDRWHDGSLPLARAIDAVAVLHDIQRSVEGSGGAGFGGGAFAALDDFLPLGMRIFDALEELTLEGVPPEKVATVQALVEGGIPPRSRQRLATLAHFLERFPPAIAARGLSTRSSRLHEVARRLDPRDLGGWKRIVVAGFFELSRAEADIIRCLAALAGTILLFREGPGLAEELERLGIGLPHRPAGPAPRPELTVTRSPDSHGQVFALAGLLGSASQDTVVVLPSADTLFPLERHCLSRLAPESYNISLPYPLRRTPLYGFLNDLMKLVATRDGERLYVPDYLTFLLHPYAKGATLRSRTEPTRVLLHELEDRLSAKRTRSFVTLEEVEADAALLRAAAARLSADHPDITAGELSEHLRSIHGETIRRFASFRDVADFAGQCIALVEWVHDRTTARLHPHFVPFADRLLESLEQIRTSLLADRRFDQPAGYFSLLRRYLAGASVPFEGTPLHGLQVLGSLETRCLRFDRVIVLDANEGVLPAVSRDDPLLPRGAREALGLRTWRERERASRYRFEELAAGARALHLFCVDDGEAEPSRFLERLLWERERDGGPPAVTRTVRYRVSLSSRTPAPLPKDPEVAAWLPTISLSPSSLDAWLACPLRFYHQRVLGLREREEVTGEIEPLDIGSFMHGALADFLGPLRGRTLDADALDPDAMERLAAARFDRDFGDGDSGTVRLLRQQLLHRLREVVTGYLAPLAHAERLAILEVERRVAASWGGVALEGKVDAVLERGGRTCIVDFKTSANPQYYRPRLDRLDPDDRAGWSKALKSVQLPAYLLMLGLETGREQSAMDAMFLLLGEMALDRGAEVRLFADLDEAARHWPTVLEVLRRLVAEVLDPAVPFAPTDDPARQCPRCPYTTICGTPWLKA